MTATTRQGLTALDRTYREEALYRVAISAFTYYPEKEADDADYSVEEDVDWCVAPIAAHSVDAAARIRPRIREVITNPDADRQAFLVRLGVLDD